MLALAVLGTAPLATWGGGCSSSMTAIHPDASGGAGTTGSAGAAGGTTGTGGVAGTSGVGGQSGAGVAGAQAGHGGIGGQSGSSGGGGGGGAAGCSGADAGCCPACCSGDNTPYCSADGKYNSCFLALSSTLPPGCAATCSTSGIYTYVWEAQTCSNGCNGRGPDGGIGGNGGAPGCR